MKTPNMAPSSASTASPEVALDDFAAAYYILHRLGIVLSNYFSPADLATCSPAPVRPSGSCPPTDRQTVLMGR